MKLKHTLALLSLATCAALSTSAFAQDTVQFTGSIITNACGSVTVQGGSTVNLPPRAHSNFGPNVGDGTGDTPFTVELDQCAPLPRTFAINFSNASASTAGPTQGFIMNTGVTNVGYELRNPASGLHINFTQVANSPSGPFDANTPTTGNVNTPGPHTLNYTVRYVRTNVATLGVGPTNATATMTVQYN